MIRVLAAAAAVLLAVSEPSPPPPTATDDPYAPVRRLLAEGRGERRRAAEEIAARGDRSLVPALVDAVFFTPRPLRGEIHDALEALTGERRRGYYEWVEFVGEHQEIVPADGYLEFKLSLLERIDRRYRQVLFPGAPQRIRLEEVISGGVPVAGIPALDRPPTVAAPEARFMRRRERVFGVLEGGEARAYPLRVLSWHEMLNDVVGGQPVTLSFCTLCGSGILYATATPGGDAYTFDTSGLLYRSNKLMLDRQSWSLWSNLTGEPVIGRRARGEVRLEMLPMTLTTWGDWLERHPDTRVLDVPELGKTFSARFGFDYRAGAADRARAGVSFPVWLRSDRLDRDAEIFALRLGAATKAYPLEEVLRREVINDRVGEREVVVVGDRETGAVRAFASPGLRFRSAGPNRLRDQDGGEWEIREHALEGVGEAAPRTLDRLPGHVAFWFGWFAFYPETEVFDGSMM